MLGMSEDSRHGTQAVVSEPSVEMHCGVSVTPLF